MTTTNMPDLPIWTLDLAGSVTMAGRPIRRILSVDLPEGACEGLMWPQDGAYYLMVDPAGAARSCARQWSPALATLFVVCHELAHAITGRGFHALNGPVREDTASVLDSMRDEAICDDLAYRLMVEHGYAPLVDPRNEAHMDAVPRTLTRRDLARAGAGALVLAELDRLGADVMTMSLPERTGGGLTIQYADGPAVIVLDLEQLRRLSVPVFEALAHELGHVDHSPYLQPEDAREAHAHRYADDLLRRTRGAERTTATRRLT